MPVNPNTCMLALARDCPPVFHATSRITIGCLEQELVLLEEPFENRYISQRIRHMRRLPSKLDSCPLV